jgi:CRP-like cAMP-binding protein
MDQSSHLSNYLLASLGADELAALLAHLKAVELPQETVFFESGDAVKSVYFPHNALVSLVVDLTAGGMIEAAMIGRDGVVVGSAAFGSKISLNRAVVQIAGSASVLDVDVFCDLADRNAVFRGRLARHEQFVPAQAQQSAACNAAHPLEARLSRWLLRCRDLLLSDDIRLTHEFLGEMLGCNERVLRSWRILCSAPA